MVDNVYKETCYNNQYTMDYSGRHWHIIYKEYRALSMPVDNRGTYCVTFTRGLLDVILCDEC